MGAGRSLPRPTTAAELYLAAILDELRLLRQATEQAQPVVTELVELREPVAPEPEPAADSRTPAEAETAPRRRKKAP